MIDGIGKSGAGRLEPQRGTLSKAAGLTAPGGAAASQRSSAGGAVADIVAAGAPVDSDKVAAIRAAIASGNYPVNPERIAQAMLDLDLPR